jgi:antitoxin component YwqK of YwqJK toxin-antitoxin module
MQRINIDDPAVDMDAAQRLLYHGELYTGEVEEYLGGKAVSRETYVDGLLDGPTREWYKDGTLRAEGNMKSGRVVGEYHTWHANGSLASKHVRSEDGNRVLAEYEWDEEGNMTRAWQADQNHLP